MLSLETRIMKLLLSTAAAVAALGIAPALAQTAAPAPAQHPHRVAAKTVTRADVQNRVGRMFAKVDANHDGFVTTAEVETVKVASSRRKTMRWSRSPPEVLYVTSTSLNSICDIHGLPHEISYMRSGRLVMGTRRPRLSVWLEPLRLSAGRSWKPRARCRRPKRRHGRTR